MSDKVVRESTLQSGKAPQVNCGPTITWVRRDGSIEKVHFKTAENAGFWNTVKAKAEKALGAATEAEENDEGEHDAKSKSN